MAQEIDAALDPPNRSTVAELIRSQAHASVKPAQYITSTFRQELVKVADMHFTVSYSRQMSSIAPKSRQECLEFVKRVEEEEEAAAAAAAAAKHMVPGGEGDVLAAGGSGR